MQTAKTLQNDIRALQVTAIERNRETRLYLVEADADWADAGPENEGVWHLQVGNKSLQSKRWDTFPEDTQEDGSDDRQGEGLVDIGEGGAQETPGVSLQPWSSLSGPGTNNADAIVFSPRGWVTNPASDFDADGYITLTLINKRALADGVTDSIDVKIARSGMVRLQTSLGRELGGGAAGTAAGSTL